jgi:hypothetical protein
MSEVRAANQRRAAYFGALEFRSNESNLSVTSSQCLRRPAKHVRNAIALAVTAALAAIGGFAQALPGSVRATVPVDKETLVPFETLPNAQCTLTAPDDKGNKVGHKFYADDGGVVRLHVRHSGASDQNLKVTIPCTAGGKSTSTLIELRANSTSTADMPPPRTDFADRIQQQLGSPLPPLVGDPATIPQEQLISMGYPPRPDAIRQPQAYATWLRMVSKPLRSIPPKLTPRDERLGASSNIWSGIALSAAPNTFQMLWGDWSVPSVYSLSPNFYGETAVWVGLDGWGSGDVVQAGTMSVVSAEQFGSDPGWTFTWYYPWKEWFPNPLSGVNLPVSPGDEIFTMVIVSGTTANYYLTNVTLGLTVPSSDTIPPNTTFVGNSAEWILERPTVDGWTVPLAPTTDPITDIVDAQAFGTGCPNSWPLGGTCDMSNTSWTSIDMVNAATGDLLAYAVPGNHPTIVSIFFVQPW